MEQRQVYRDAYGVRRTLIWDDERPDRVTVHTEQDVEEILAGIARKRELHRARGDNVYAATLPLIVVEDLTRRGIYDDRDAFDAWLNSPEAEPFRIWRGRV